MHYISWQLKMQSVMVMIDQVFRDGNQNLNLPNRGLYHLIHQVGEDIEDLLDGDWDDEIFENDLPEVFHEWLISGYEMEDYADWTPAQLMAAYGASRIKDTTYWLDDILPENSEEEYNCRGFRRDQSIEQCAANIIAALECVHYGRLLIVDKNKIINDPKRLAELMNQHMAKANSERARNAVNRRHDKPGGARDKQVQIRDIWASGKYTTRDICAEQECAALDMSFSTARKALRNTPDPT